MMVVGKTLDKSGERIAEIAYTIIGVAIIILLTSFAFHPIIRLNFSGPDDRWMLLKYTDVHPNNFSFSYLHKVFTSFNDIQYSPVNTLYYYLIYQINGYDAYYYHLCSFVFHLLNTLVIYFIAKRIFTLFNIGNINMNAYIVCLLWSILPLNVEPVVWISASKVLLFTFFSLLSFLNFIKAFQYRKTKYYIYSTLLFLLSCFCKEQSIVTPVMFILFVACYKWKQEQKLLKKERWILYIIIMLLISVIFGIISLKANALGTSEFMPMAEYPFSQRIILSFYCISFYLTNLIVPIHLHYHYPFPIKPNEWMPINFYIYPVVFICFCAVLIPVIKQSKNAFFYLLCIGIFFLQIGLVLQIIPMTRPAIMADRYMYIPSFALLLIFVSIGVNDLYLKLKQKKYKYIIQLAFIIYVLALTIYSNALAYNWTKINLIK